MFIFRVFFLRHHLLLMIRTALRAEFEFRVCLQSVKHTWESTWSEFARSETGCSRTRARLRLAVTWSRRRVRGGAYSGSRWSIGWHQLSWRMEVSPLARFSECSHLRPGLTCHVQANLSSSQSSGVNNKTEKPFMREFTAKTPADQKVFHGSFWVRFFLKSYFIFYFLKESVICCSEILKETLKARRRSQNMINWVSPTHILYHS